jgi:predicted Ser/Thr protein kinase
MRPILWGAGEALPSHLDRQFIAVSKVLDEDAFKTDEVLQALATLKSISDEAVKHDNYRPLLIQYATHLARVLEFVHNKVPEAKESLKVALLAANSVSGDAAEESAKRRLAIINELARLSREPVNEPVAPIRQICQDVFNKYLDNIEASVTERAVERSRSFTRVQPGGDRHFMTEVESGVPEREVLKFRTETLWHVNQWLSKNPEATEVPYDECNEKIRHCIESYVVRRLS